MSGPYAFCGNRTVFGTATPMRAASPALKNLSSTMRQNGLLMTRVPQSAASFKYG
jgi:hypothetical protein